MNDPYADLGKSMIRTLVPIIVGVTLAGFAKAGAHINSDVLSAIVTAGLIAAYYTVARIIETRFPALGTILISAGLVAEKPTYVTGTAPTTTPGGSA